MNRITPSKYTKLLALILLTRFNNEINSLELSCNITSQSYLNETQTDVKPIIGVNKCAADYHDVEIIKKCEYFIDSNQFETNFLLYTPVTNLAKNLAYWNEFCAVCNYETELEYWPTWMQLNTLEFVCKLYEFEVLIGSSVNNLHQMTRNFIRNGLKLISKSLNSTELQCSADENLPLNILRFIVPCLTEQFRKSQQKRLDSCQYFKNNGRICLEMKIIIEGMDFVLDKNNEIFLFKESINQEFIQSGYSINSGIDNVIYLCEKNNMRYGIFKWVEIVVIIFSIIFIVFYLYLNFTKRYFKSFPNKIIYSYAIGLLVMYVFLGLVHLLFPLSCVGFFLAQFSWFFHFFWTIIMTLEFCRLTYSTIKKRKVTVSSQPKRYFIYCIIGYVIPIVLPVVYFIILETDDNRCPTIPDHFGVPCMPAKNSTAAYFMVWLIYIFDGSFFIVIPILFLLQAGVLIYVTKCGPTPIRSTAKRNHLIVLMKMGYIMGAHWILYVFCVYYGYDRNSAVVTTASTISQLSIDFQGIFVFLAFGFKKTWISDVLVKFGCREKSTQQSISAGAGTTVQFSSSTVQSNDLTEAEE